MRDPPLRARIEDVDLVVARTRDVEPLAHRIQRQLPRDGARRERGAFWTQGSSVEHIDGTAVLVADEERIRAVVKRDPKRERKLGATGDYARKGTAQRDLYRFPSLSKR